MKRLLVFTSLSAGLGIVLICGQPVYPHGGLVDGYGCHTDPKTKRYHCHQGEFAGQSFKSKQEFLQKLRGGSKDLSPQTITPRTGTKTDRND
jgi:hypothetical protein